MENIIITSKNTNCYLLKTQKGVVLIDSGYSINEEEFLKKLDESGVKKGENNYLILTHGHYDHVGNSMILKEKYNFQIAIHKADLDLLNNPQNIEMDYNTSFARMILRLSKKQLKNSIWTDVHPDLLLNDQDELKEMGINGKVLHLPGHTKGSIGILIDTGALYCGDTFMNIKYPQPALLAEDFTELNRSIKKIFNEKINIFYPGHGKCFMYVDLKDK